MGNCQQCTNFAQQNQTAEIKTKLTKSKHTLNFVNKFTPRNVEGVIKIQAVFKGYLTRKQLSLLSTQQNTVHQLQIETFQDLTLSAMSMKLQINRSLSS